eukprot:scaffold30458_cov56-Isochrysis_galbana.AAC.1
MIWGSVLYIARRTSPKHSITHHSSGARAKRPSSAASPSATPGGSGGIGKRRATWQPKIGEMDGGRPEIGEVDGGRPEIGE